jgi:hypothetical protein
MTTGNLFGISGHWHSWEGPASTQYRFDIQFKLLIVNTTQSLGLQTHLKHFLLIFLYTGAKKVQHLCCIIYCHVNYGIHNKIMDSTEINQHYSIFLPALY